MPFEYSSYDSSRPAATIAELMLRRGDIEGQRAMAVAQAAADAQRQSGAAWGNALANIGNTVSNTIREATDPARKADALKVKELEQHQKFRSDLSEVLKNTPQAKEDGVSVWNVQDIANQLAAKGHGAFTGDVVKSLSGLNEAFRHEASAKRALVQQGAQAVQRAGNDPVFAHHFLDQLEANQSYPKEQIAEYRQFIDADPGNVAKLTAYLAGPPKLKEVPQGGSLVNENLPQQPVFTAPNPTADVAKARAEEQARHNAAMEAAAAAGERRQELQQQETERHNKEMERLEGKKVAQQGADVTDLTPAGLDAAALNFAKTGQLPPLGMGDKTTRKKIINRAAEMMPGLDVASAKADFTANQDSLKALQKQRDALGAFESTALKNLKQFTDLAAKIPDTGSPWLNQPLRAINQNALGGDVLAAFNAARQTVVPEFAKILANPGLSGQLSDSARHEVESVMSGNATLKQILAVSKVLTQDVENRRTSYDDQIAAIKGRISKAQTQDTSGGERVRVKGPNGQTGTVRKGTALPAGWSLQ